MIRVALYRYHQKCPATSLAEHTLSTFIYNIFKIILIFVEKSIDICHKFTYNTKYVTNTVCVDQINEQE